MDANNSLVVKSLGLKPQHRVRANRALINEWYKSSHITSEEYCLLSRMVDKERLYHWERKIELAIHTRLYALPAYYKNCNL